MSSDNEHETAINLEDIISEMSSSFNVSLKAALTPFVDRVNTIDGNYKIMTEFLRTMPEFKDLVAENAALRKELAEMRSSDTEYPSVTLEVTEKQRGDEDANTLVKQVYTDVNLESHDETRDTIVSSYSETCASSSDDMYDDDEDENDDDDDDEKNDDDEEKNDDDEEKNDDEK